MAFNVIPRNYNLNGKYKVVMWCQLGKKQPTKEQKGRFILIKLSGKFLFRARDKSNSMARVFSKESRQKMKVEFSIRHKIFLLNSEFLDKTIWILNKANNELSC